MNSDGMNSILPDADRREASACRTTTEPAVTSERVHPGSRRSTGALLPSSVESTLSASEEIREANEQFVCSALRYCRNFPGAEVAEIPGLVIAWRNTPVPISNAIFLSRPVDDEHDLRQRMKAVAEYLGHRDKPSTLLLCGEWLPRPLRSAGYVQVATAGLALATTMTGMAADDLLPARRRAVPIYWRLAIDEVTRRDFADINSTANGFQVEAERAALCVPQLWGDDGLNGYVGYLENGTPVAAAGVMVLHSKLHVVCVATRPGYRRKGFAEWAIRHALEEMRRSTGLTRTTLSATAAGRPLYRRIGYHETATFVVYQRPERQSLKEPS